MTIIFQTGDFWIEFLEETGTGTVVATGVVKTLTLTLSKAGRYVGGSAVILRDSTDECGGCSLIDAGGGILNYGEIVESVRSKVRNRGAGNDTIRLGAIVMMRK